MIFESQLEITTITAFFTFGSIQTPGIGGSFESQPNGLSFVENILQSFHESPTAFILLFIMFGIIMFTIIIMSINCVLVFQITFYYGLEVTQISNGFNQSMDRMFLVEKEVAKNTSTSSTDNAVYNESSGPEK
jgi:hypothetical protein